jgi:hypothetical protein
MSYTNEDVDNAERAIRAACPGAQINRANYDRTLVVAKPDGSEIFLVFDDHDRRLIVIGDVAAIIKALNVPSDAPKTRHMVDELVDELRENAASWENEANNGGRTNQVEDLLTKAADYIEFLRAELTELVVRYGLDWPASLE